MARTIGSINKEIKLPKVFEMTAEERLEALALILTDIVSEEICTQE